MADLLIAVLVLLVCSGAESAALMVVEAVLHKRAALERQPQRGAKKNHPSPCYYEEENVSRYDDWKLREPPEPLPPAL